MRWNTGLKVKYNGSVPTVIFLPLHTAVVFEPSRLVYKGHGRPGSILDVALNHGIALEHSCGGNCACTTCHVIVRQGEQNLSAIEDAEADRLEMAANLTLHSRLACQAVVEGDVTVEIAEK
jgi:ferredoxin, 2Fe-2S